MILKELTSFIRYRMLLLFRGSVGLWGLLFAIPFLLSKPISGQNSNKASLLLYSGLNNPSSLYISQNEIYVIEQGANRVLKLNQTGEILDSYGNKGSGDYQFDQPFDIDATNGLKVFVSDQRNRRIQVFDKRWQLLSSFKSSKPSSKQDFIEPAWLGVDRLGDLLFFDLRSKRIYRYDQFGTYLDEIPLPTEVKQVDGLQVAGNKLYLLDRKLNVIHQLSASGFYEKFYTPSVKVQAFHMFNNNLWYSSGNQLIGDELNKLSVQDNTFSKEIRDIAVRGNGLYVLTVDAVYRLELSER